MCNRLLARKRTFTASGSIIVMSGGGLEGFYCVRAACALFWTSTRERDFWPGRVTARAADGLKLPPLDAVQASCLPGPTVIELSSVLVLTWRDAADKSSVGASDCSVSIGRPVVEMAGGAELLWGFIQVFVTQSQITCCLSKTA